MRCSITSWSTRWIKKSPQKTMTLVFKPDQPPTSQRPAPHHSNSTRGYINQPHRDPFLPDPRSPIHTDQYNTMGSEEFECTAGSIPSRTQCILTYGGSERDILINYALV